MEDIIEENMGLVVSIVNTFNPKNETERQDLIDAGRIGLWKAIKKYNPKNNVKVCTFAWRPIRWAIIRELQRRNNCVSLSEIAEPMIHSKERIWELLPSDTPEQERKIVRMRCEGYRFKEISEEMQEEPDVIKNKFYKLIRKLKEENKDD
jgi:RNA polymerase sigma factor (sigma-70 family)